jgi:hypothetical protein
VVLEREQRAEIAGLGLPVRELELLGDGVDLGGLYRLAESLRRQAVAPAREDADAPVAPDEPDLAEEARQVADGEEADDGRAAQDAQDAQGGQKGRGGRNGGGSRNGPAGPDGGEPEVSEEHDEPEV